MRRLDLTLPTPEANLALDEALLEWAEADGPAWEFLRIWEFPQPLVVVGRSSRVSQEVEVAVCRRRGIPILRRSSGGAAIVAGPGCLMYAVVLSFETRPELRDIRRAHGEILNRLAAALRPHVAPVADIVRSGTSDLVIAATGATGSARAGLSDTGERWQRQRHQSARPRKFSGNSLRVKRSHLLYHGTLLYDFDLALAEACLREPPRQPDYRQARAHRDFMTNLPLVRDKLIQAIDEAWPSSESVTKWPQDRVDDLVVERFGRDDWNLSFGT